jgi:cytochrome bd-type quinol oxidase subunit 2
MGMFKASIFASVVIPVLLWAYSFIYKLLSKDKDKDKDD